MYVIPLHPSHCTPRAAATMIAGNTRTKNPPATATVRAVSSRAKRGAIFRNRVDQLVAEVTYVAQHVLTPLKRGRRKMTSESPAPPPVKS